MKVRQLDYAEQGLRPEDGAEAGYEPIPRRSYHPGAADTRRNVPRKPPPLPGDTVESAAFRRGYLYGVTAALGIAGRGFALGLPPTVVMGGLNNHRRDVEAWIDSGASTNTPRFVWDVTTIKEYGRHTPDEQMEEQGK